MASFTSDMLAWFKGLLGPKEVRIVIAYPGHVNVEYHAENMEGAIKAFDTFNHQVYWPLRNVGTYLGRMGV